MSIPVNSINPSLEAGSPPARSESGLLKGEMNSRVLNHFDLLFRDEYRRQQQKERGGEGEYEERSKRTYEEQVNRIVDEAAVCEYLSRAERLNFALALIIQSFRNGWPGETGTGHENRITGRETGNKGRGLPATSEAVKKLISATAGVYKNTQQYYLNAQGSIYTGSL